MTARSKINIQNVRQLLRNQFPDFANLTITETNPQGWDHTSYRLGDSYVARFPNAEYYAPQINKEFQWLPYLSKNLSTPIPKPLYLGKPDHNFNWHWTISKWIEGTTATLDSINDNYEFTYNIAYFLDELLKVPILNAPHPSPHNFYRGGDLIHYDQQVQQLLRDLEDRVDVIRATHIWQVALASSWTNNPVWIHGDFAPSNIIIEKNKLKAVIDFGLCAVGDPACDLTIAWSFLSEKNRDIFKTLISLDTQTWERSKAWALWKAMLVLNGQSEQKSNEIDAIDIIESILIE